LRGTAADRFFRSLPPERNGNQERDNPVTRPVPTLEGGTVNNPLTARQMRDARWSPWQIGQAYRDKRTNLANANGALGALGITRGTAGAFLSGNPTSTIPKPEDRVGKGASLTGTGFLKDNDRGVALGGGRTGNGYTWYDQSDDPYDQFTPEEKRANPKYTQGQIYEFLVKGILTQEEALDQLWEWHGIYPAEGMNVFKTFANKDAGGKKLGWEGFGTTAEGDAKIAAGRGGGTDGDPTVDTVIGPEPWPMVPVGQPKLGGTGLGKDITSCGQ